MKQLAVCPGPHSLSETYVHSLLAPPSYSQGVQRVDPGRCGKPAGVAVMLIQSATFPKAASNVASALPHVPPVIF